jgi:hypothetical protein
MIRESLAFVTAFGICAVLGGATPACNPCDCPATPERPDAQQALMINYAVNYNSEGNEGELAINPEGGTLEITGDSVVIQYNEAGIDHTIVYAVVGPR